MTPVALLTFKRIHHEGSKDAKGHKGIEGKK
jgi:hypothetical protein